MKKLIFLFLTKLAFALTYQELAFMIVNHKINNLDDEFIFRYEDNNSSINPTNIYTINPKCNIKIFDTDNFSYIYDSNKTAFIIRFSIGNNENLITRNFSYISRKNLLITQKHYTTEWINFPTKGKRILQNEKLYFLSTKNCKITITPTTYKKLYSQEDKILNKTYIQKMKILTPKEKTRLKNIQRAWLKYITLKCKYPIKPQKNSDIYQCLYNETKKRVGELKKITK